MKSIIEKKCTLCLQIKPAEEFYKVKAGKYLSPKCKVCSRALNKEYLKKNPRKYVNRFEETLKRRYKIDLKGLIALLESQGNLCPICDLSVALTDRYNIDHDHRCCPGSETCGKCVRGVLHEACNRKVGWYETIMPLLDSIEDYVNGNLK